MQDYPTLQKPIPNSAYSVEVSNLSEFRMGCSCGNAKIKVGHEIAIDLGALDIVNPDSSDFPRIIEGAETILVTAMTREKKSAAARIEYRTQKLKIRIPDRTYRVAEVGEADDESTLPFYPIEELPHMIDYLERGRHRGAEGADPNRFHAT